MAKFKSKTKLNAAIIGAGNIGAFYDNSKSGNILTHAHAYVKHPAFRLVGFVDINQDRAQKAAVRWRAKAYQSLENLFRAETIDVVSICVPDKQHAETLSEIQKYSVLGGIIEKPFTNNLIVSEKIIKSHFFKSHNFLVNYSRRYVPEFQDLGNKIRGGQYGKFLHGVGLYGKGILHNGSHIFDLLAFFGIVFDSVYITSKLIDFVPEDPTYSLIAKSKKRYFFNLNAVAISNFDIFDVDLVFEKGRIKIFNNGFLVEEYRVKTDKIFPVDKTLYLHDRYKTQLNRALYFVVDNLYNIIQGNKQPLCTLADAYKVQKFCSYIQE